jgi:hypothetical protein
LIPKAVAIFAIEGETWAPGAPTGHKVELAAELVAEEIARIGAEV